jgi:hypothetical protein
MRVRHFLFALAVLAAGAARAEPEEIKIINAPANAVERRVIEYYRDYWSINASVGGAKWVHVPDRPNYVVMLLVQVHIRMKQDMLDLYGDTAGVAEEAYALLAADDEKREQLVIVRLRNVQTDGSFVRLKGLHYNIKEGGIVSVTGTDY